jgi:hypothetical protein
VPRVNCSVTATSPVASTPQMRSFCCESVLLAWSKVTPLPEVLMKPVSEPLKMPWLPRMPSS